MIMMMILNTIIYPKMEPHRAFRSGPGVKRSGTLRTRSAWKRFMCLDNGQQTCGPCNSV